MARTSTTQRKALKGTVAAATGVALLLGGFGTWAEWNAKTGTDGPDGEVEAGELNVAYNNDWQDGEWMYPGEGGKADVIVPGDVLTRVDTGTITVSGKGDIEFKVTADVPTTIPSDGGEETWGTDNLTSTSTVSVDGEGSTGSFTDEGAVTADDGTISKTFAVSVTTTLTYALEDGVNDEMNTSYTVDSLPIPQVIVTQTGVTYAATP